MAKIGEDLNIGKSTRFPHNDPTKGGRPRKLIGTVNKELEEKGVLEASKAEILSCYLRLVNLSIEELETIEADNTQPALIRIVSKNILSGKGFEIIEKMLDRGIGKAEQSVDHTTGGEKLINKMEVIFKDFSEDAE